MTSKRTDPCWCNVMVARVRSLRPFHLHSGSLHKHSHALHSHITNCIVVGWLVFPTSGCQYFRLLHRVCSVAETNAPRHPTEHTTNGLNTATSHNALMNGCTLHSYEDSSLLLTALGWVSSRQGRHNWHLRKAIRPLHQRCSRPNFLSTLPCK